MRVTMLRLVEYRSQFEHEVTNVPEPSWEQIETSIRRLDGHRFPYIYLILAEGPPVEQEMNVMGGQGLYRVAVTLNGYFHRRLYFLGQRPERVQIWTSDQGGWEYRRHLTPDLALVLRAARYFCEHGDFDPELGWEERDEEEPEGDAEPDAAPDPRRKAGGGR